MTETVKGFKDYAENDAKKREKIKEILIRNFKLYCFEPSETPLIEYENFVRGENSDDETVSDIFKLKDKGNRKLALRYEFTFQLKRLIKNKKLPYKRYQIGEVFRDEPVSANRVRQITQCDIDIIGSNAKDEVEILSLTSKILKELKINFQIYVNNRKLLNEILDKEKINEKDKKKIIKEIDKLDKLTEKEVNENLKKYNAEKILNIFKKPESYFKKYDSYKEIVELKKYCKIYGVKINFLSSLARGLSYYNGSVFEIKTRNMKESICGGGSFLVNGIQSTGISLGLERLSSLAEIKSDEKRILIVSIGEDEKAIKLGEKLRASGINCEIMFGKISKSLEYANSKDINYVAFIGKQEVKKKKIKIRDMKTGKEKLVSEQELVGKII
ncbi:MAG: ATP phosphoribosyltransferase regulatory subunit [Nanoarchaeota archaeon]|nr:histidine--tRNA ligase [Nanoarchaeota archaeon]